LFDETNNIGYVLCDREFSTPPIPLLRKEVPQAQRDHAVPLRERTEHCQPAAKIIKRAVDADKGSPAPDLDIRHVIVIHT
jgi:hypothetical protein